MLVQVECIYCKHLESLPITEDQFNRWQGGESIQKAMPNLSDDQREMLISRTCGACWADIFPPEE